MAPAPSTHLSTAPQAGTDETVVMVVFALPHRWIAARPAATSVIAQVHLAPG